MSTVQFTLRIDPSIKAQLEDEARRDDRSASNLAVRAIKSFLQAKEAKRKAVQEAVREAEKGIFVSEKAVDAWVDSWGSENKLPVPEPDVFPDK